MAEVVAREVTRRWRFTTGGASEADYSPLDLRPGDLKARWGTVEKMEKSKELLTLRVVTRAQSYGASEQAPSPPRLRDS